METSGRKHCIGVVCERAKRFEQGFPSYVENGWENVGGE